MNVAAWCCVMAVILGGCVAEEGSQPSSPSSTTLSEGTIEVGDITVITEPLQLSHTLTLEPAGELPATLPDLDVLAREAHRLMANNPDATGPEVFYGRIHRPRTTYTSDGAVVIVVRVEGVLGMPSGPPGAPPHGPVPTVATAFYDVATGQEIMREERGCDPTGCTSPTVST